MKDHEIRELVTELTEIAQQYGQTQQLRERIRGIVFKHIPPSFFSTGEQRAIPDDTAEAKPVTLSKDQIRAIFLGAGFTIKEGQSDLRPYVYDAAYCLLSAVASASSGGTAWEKPVNYEELEREHFGDAESGTGIYAPRPAIEASIADTAGAKPVLVRKGRTAKDDIYASRSAENFRHILTKAVCGEWRALFNSTRSPETTFEQFCEWMREELAATPANSVADEQQRADWIDQNVSGNPVLIQAMKNIAGASSVADAAEEKPVAIPGTTVKLMLDALNFYSEGKNFEWVTFGKGRDEQLKRLQADSTWIQDADDYRGHEQFHENGAKAGAAIEAFDNCFLEDGDWNHGAYDAVIAGQVSLYTAPPASPAADTAGVKEAFEEAFQLVFDGYRKPRDKFDTDEQWALFIYHKIIKAITPMQKVRASLAATPASSVANTVGAKPTPVTDDMVSRFLGWKLPKDFYPDCYIAFDREKAEKAYAQYGSWPSGTNLLHAGQARAMLEHVLATPPASSVADAADAHTVAQWQTKLRDPILPGCDIWINVSEEAARKAMEKWSHIYEVRALVLAPLL